MKAPDDKNRLRLRKNRKSAAAFSIVRETIEILVSEQQRAQRRGYDGRNVSVSVRNIRTSWGTGMNSNVLIEIFDPPMCCPGGLCGPVIDPALLDLHEAVLKLKNEHGVVVPRYLLQQHGAKFMQNQEVLALLKEQGTGVLPVTTVNGEVVKTKEFPTYDELLRYVQQPRTLNVK
jgi:hypothetical protein